MIGKIEKKVIEVIATDRVYKTISSMSGKLDRKRPKLAKAIDLSDFDNRFVGERAYARVETDDTMKKSRTLRKAIDEFAEKYPRHGKILNGMIEEERAARETCLYFGVNEGCKLTADDYIGVMTDLGFTQATAIRLYPELMDESRKLARKRQETERSILIG